MVDALNLSRPGLALTRVLKQTNALSQIELKDRSSSRIRPSPQIVIPNLLLRGSRATASKQSVIIKRQTFDVGQYVGAIGTGNDNLACVMGDRITGARAGEYGRVDAGATIKRIVASGTSGRRAGNVRRAREIDVRSAGARVPRRRDAREQHDHVA